jgi:hypothetical protein
VEGSEPGKRAFILGIPAGDATVEEDPGLVIEATEVVAMVEVEVVAAQIAAAVESLWLPGLLFLERGVGLDLDFVGASMTETLPVGLVCFLLREAKLLVNSSWL